MVQKLYRVEPEHSRYIKLLAMINGMTESEYIRMLIECDMDVHQKIVENHKNIIFMK